jgi:hypothetical protein
VPTSAETEYVYPLRYPEMIVRGRANAVTMPVYDTAGTVVTVTASGSTFTLLDPAGTAVVNAAAVTVSGGIPSYSILAATLPTTLTPLGDGWQEVWVLQTPTGERTIDREAALILRPLYPVLMYTDLLEDYPTLATWGLTAAQWGAFLTAAWGEIINALIGAGHVPYRIKSSAAFRDNHKHRTYAKGFNALALHQNTRGNWAALATSHDAKADAAWKAINFTTDDDDDGRVDDASTRRSGAGTVLNLNTPLTRYPRRLPWQ